MSKKSIETTDGNIPLGIYKLHIYLKA